MSTAVLTPRLDGCLFELNGIEQAEAEVLARGLLFTVDRFPATAIVIAESPAMRVI
jgi:hypothetical protein